MLSNDEIKELRSRFDKLQPIEMACLLYAEHRNVIGISRDGFKKSRVNALSAAMLSCIYCQITASANHYGYWQVVFNNLVTFRDNPDSVISYK